MEEVAHSLVFPKPQHEQSNPTVQTNQSQSFSKICMTFTNHYMQHLVTQRFSQVIFQKCFPLQSQNMKHKTLGTKMSSSLQTQVTLRLLCLSRKDGFYNLLYFHELFFFVVFFLIIFSVNEVSFLFVICYSFYYSVTIL